MSSNISLRDNLQTYLPGLFGLLNNKSFKPRQWDKINTNLREELKRRRAILEKGQSIKVETNIYDIIIGVFNGEMPSTAYYQYLLILFRRLTRNLEEDERDKLRHTLYRMFTEIDHKYRNFVGELSVLNNVREHYKNYRLIAVDKDIIVDRRKADFSFKNIETGKIELVEVVNIHAYQKTEEFDLKKFIVNKIEEKISNKTNGKTEYKSFTLVPVFWGAIAEMRRLSDIFKNERGMLPTNVVEPLALCSFDSPDIPVHRFVKISELFTEDTIEVIPYQD